MTKLFSKNTYLGYLAVTCLSVFASLFIVSPVFAVDKYLADTAFQIGEFVYEDDYTPSTADCEISIWNPSGTKVVDEVTMDEEASGWHYYDFAGSSTLGTWPVEISCGTAGIDLIKQNKSFVLEAAPLTDSIIANASSSIAAIVNANTNTQVQNASTSIVTLVNANTSVASSSLGEAVTNASSSIVSMILSSIISIPENVWTYSSRTLSAFGSIVSDTIAGVWGAATRTLTGAGLSSGTLATQSDVQSASSSVVAEINSNTTTQTSGIVSSVNSNTDTVVATASSSIVALVNANTNSASSSAVSLINANTDTIVGDASSSLGASITNASSSIVSTIVSAITSIPANVWAYGGRTLTSLGSLATDVWSAATRTLTGSSLDTGSLATQSDVQSASSSVVALVNANTNTASSSLNASINANTNSALSSASSSVVALVNANTNTASSSLTAVINANTNSVVSSASSSVGSAIASASSSIVSQLVSSLASIPADVWAYSSRTLSSFGTLVADIAGGVWGAATRTLSESENTSSWQVSVSGFSSVTAGGNYRATVVVTNNGSLTDSASAPTVTLYDPSRNTVVSGVALTNVSTGVYSYTYTTAANAEAGNWESAFSVAADVGKTLSGTHYWNVVSSPAQVLINSVTTTLAPTISANVTITNEGLTGYEYQYEWCVVSTVDNACGGGNDTYYAMAAKYINPGEDFNTNLSATVSSAGDYYFKLKVYFGSDSSVSSRSFNIASSGGESGGGGGGGGGDSSGAQTQILIPAAGTPKGADFNGDGVVNSVDFSIMLTFWNTAPPFKNTFVDLNKDGKVNSVDFSIFLYNWGKKI